METHVETLLKAVLKSSMQEFLHVVELEVGEHTQKELDLRNEPNRIYPTRPLNQPPIMR